jgi:hypothetical protein
LAHVSAVSTDTLIANASDVFMLVLLIVSTAAGGSFNRCAFHGETHWLPSRSLAAALAALLRLLWEL